MEPPAAGLGQIADLEPLLRRVIGARVSDAATVEDLVQETLARVLAVGNRLDDTSVEAYSIVIARNLVRSLARSEERRQRLLPRLFDPRLPEDPSQRATEGEERRALTDALAQLAPEDREALIAHHVEGVHTATLGRQLGASAGAVSVRLARARARLRVEYLVARQPLPLLTPVCKPVLLALSNGDQRRQQALKAGEHLLICPSCAGMSQTLVQRRRPLGPPWPASTVAPLVSWLRRSIRSHSLGIVATTAAVVAGVAAVTVGASERQPAPVGAPSSVSAAPPSSVPAAPPSSAPAAPPSSASVAPPPTLIVQSDPSVALSGDENLAAYDGQAVKAQKARVYAAPGDAGFWIGESGTKRVWVDLESGARLPQRVAAGELVSFVGKVVPNGPQVIKEPGVGSPPDIERLRSQGSHVHMDGATLRVEG